MSVSFGSLTIANQTKTSNHKTRRTIIAKALRGNSSLLKSRPHKIMKYVRTGGILPLLNEPFFNIEDGMRQVKGTLAIEGYYLENNAEELIKSKILGHISEKEFMRRVLELAYE